ncbi:MAG: hypothetical protein ACLFU6_08005 [Candidatus Hydrogenedentota bacterium]
MTDRCKNARKTIEALKARRVLADGRKKTQRLAEAVWPRMNSIPPAVILLLGVSVFCWSGHLGGLPVVEAAAGPVGGPGDGGGGGPSYDRRLAGIHVPPASYRHSTAARVLFPLSEESGP